MTQDAYVRLVLRNRQGQPRLTPELIDVLLEKLRSVGQARIVTIEGSAGMFCEGLDLASAVGESGKGQSLLAWEETLQGFASLLAAIQAAPVPVVAVVDGPAMGGGVGLAAVADLVLASPRASFALPETLMGLVPAVIFPYVARRIGVPRARLLALGAKPLSAQTALAFGLVDEVEEDLALVLDRYVTRFIRMDRRAVAVMKDLVASFFGEVGDYQHAAIQRFAQLMDSDDTRFRLLRFAAGETPWPEEE